MTFPGDRDLHEGRSPSQTTTLLLRQCLGLSWKSQGKEIDDFFEGMAIKQTDFARDIDVDWAAQPFVGQHAFKILQAAGYEGTPNDLWQAVTGQDAPYHIQKPAKKPAPKKRKTA